jgi:integrase
MPQVIQLAALAIGEARRGSEGTGWTVPVLAERHLAWVQKNRKRKTYRIRRFSLQSFVDYLHGAGSAPLSFPARELLPFHVSGWMDANPGWSANTRRTSIASVQAMLNWGRRYGYLESNPLAGRVDVPPAESRGEASRLPDSLLRAILAECRNRRQEDVIVALVQSGCRPGEIGSVTAERVNVTGGFMIVEGKMGARAVGLTPQLSEVLTRLTAEHPTGPLFRNAHGAAWKPHHIERLFTRIRARLRKAGKAVPRLTTPYALRHTAASEMLAAGVPPAIVAKQLGHSVQTLYKHYEHLKAADVVPHLQGVRPLRADGQTPPGAGVIPGQAPPQGRGNDGSRSAL